MADTCKCVDELPGFIKLSLLGEKLLASQGLCSMELARSLMLRFGQIFCLHLRVNNV